MLEPVGCEPLAVSASITHAHASHSRSDSSWRAIALIDHFSDPTQPETDMQCLISKPLLLFGPIFIPKMPHSYLYIASAGVAVFANLVQSPSIDPLAHGSRDIVYSTHLVH
jgi:hypothetical protein